LATKVGKGLFAVAVKTSDTDFPCNCSAAAAERFCSTMLAEAWTREHIGSSERAWCPDVHLRIEIACCLFRISEDFFTTASFFSSASSTRIADCTAGTNPSPTINDVVPIGRLNIIATSAVTVTSVVPDHVVT
jgi:hypothetical protein